MPKGRLVAAILGALALAALIVLGAILPAEFNRDPLGVGRLSGLSRLWAPEDRQVDTKAAGVARAREYDTPFRSDVVEIPLGDFMAGADRSELEYKVRMKKDATLIYAWEVIGTDEPRDIHFDQHGHTTPAPGQAMSVATYRQAFGLKQQGALTAPFDGIQGWQFSNAGDKPVVVRLRLSGFYELIPSGQPGNEAAGARPRGRHDARPRRPMTALSPAKTTAGRMARSLSASARAAIAASTAEPTFRSASPGASAWRSKTPGTATGTAAASAAMTASTTDPTPARCRWAVPTASAATWNP